MIYVPVFVAVDRNANCVVGMYEPGAVDHLNFRGVYSLVRDQHPYDRIDLYARTEINGAELITKFHTLRP